MRVFETSVQELKHEVLRSVARLAWHDNLQTGILDIPEEIIPGPEAKMRCCIYKERAIISQRVKVAMGGDKTNPNLVEVLDIACDECPVTEITVGPSCRGCIATRCIHTCPKDAISIVGHRDQIDHKKCITCVKCINACPYSAIEKKTRPCERAGQAGLSPWARIRRPLLIQPSVPPAAPVFISVPSAPLWTSLLLWTPFRCSRARKSGASTSTPLWPPPLPDSSRLQSWARWSPD